MRRVGSIKCDIMHKRVHGGLPSYLEDNIVANNPLSLTIISLTLLKINVFLQQQLL